MSIYRYREIVMKTIRRNGIVMQCNKLPPCNTIIPHGHQFKSQLLPLERPTWNSVWAFGLGLVQPSPLWSLEGAKGTVVRRGIEGQSTRQVTWA